MNLKKTALVVVGSLVGLAAAAVVALIVWMSAADRTNGSVIAEGAVRRYLLHVPSAYDRSRPAPLVISLHGANGWPAQQMGLSGWNRVADENGFLVLYPSARGFPRVWRRADVRMIEQVIDTLAARYNIDVSRIYVDGFSQGASMAFVLSCALPSRFAAVGLVAAAHEWPASACDREHPIPMISFHGTADPIGAYHGGKNPIGPGTFPSIAAWTVDWARRNGCAVTPSDSQVSAHVGRREYASCAGRSSVILYSVQGGGHQWPGGPAMLQRWLGRGTTELDATAVMWDFFRHHRRQTSVQ